MTIRMEIEQVSKLYDRCLEFTQNTYHSSEVFSSLNNRGIWQGDVADYFWEQLKNICDQLHLTSEDAAKLSYALYLEKTQWEEVDNQGVYRIRGTNLSGRSSKDPSWLFKQKRKIEDRVDEVENLIFNKDYKRFKEWWQTQSIDEKKAYLQNLQNEYADRMGWPRMLIVTDDLIDPANGDFRGVNLDEIMIIDIDNINTDEPWRLMETMFHETRHQYQREVVSNYQSDHFVPPGMTQDEVEKWVYESEHYIDGNDDFEGYYKQSIESDARKWGDIVMKDVLDDMKDDPWLNSGGGGGW